MRSPLAWVALCFLVTSGACAAGADQDGGRSRPGVQVPTVDVATMDTSTNDDSLGGAGSGADFGNATANPGPAPMEILNPGGGDCAPGHYVGEFGGTYNSASWGNGAFPLAIEAVESEGRPGLEFWLEKQEKECTSSEFCGDFSVQGGKIRGFANPFADPNGGTSLFAIAVRFEIDFGGELDCTTGEFRGLLQNGCYDVATRLYRFAGEAPASYDKTTSTFTNGVWSVKEMQMAGVIFPPDAAIGGAGEWGASLQDDGSSPVAAGMGLCDGP